MQKVDGGHLARRIGGGLGQIFLKDVVEIVILRIHAAFTAVLRLRSRGTKTREEGIMESFYAHPKETFCNAPVFFFSGLCASALTTWWLTACDVESDIFEECHWSCGRELNECNGNEEELEHRTRLFNLLSQLTSVNAGQFR